MWLVPCSQVLLFSKKCLLAALLARGRFPNHGWELAESWMVGLSQRCARVGANILPRTDVSSLWLLQQHINCKIHVHELVEAHCLFSMGLVQCQSPKDSFFSAAFSTRQSLSPNAKTHCVGQCFPGAWAAGSTRSGVCVLLHHWAPCIPGSASGLGFVGTFPGCRWSVQHPIMRAETL